jgi:SAM-dependent methyltransferase
MKSYSSESRGLPAMLRESLSLYRSHSLNIEGHVRSRIEDAKRVEVSVRQLCGIELQDLDILEVGPGQFLMQMTYFSVHNRIVGIDRDVVVRGFKPLAYASMFVSNGYHRTIKTLGRKLLGIDRKYASQLASQLNLHRLPKLNVHAMDVCKMSLASKSFDFVYCRSVLHCLRDPIAALDEIVRVLRPGGVAYISIQPYTSQDGCLDPRVFTDRWKEVACWPHLRPHLRDTIDPPNVFLNRLRLDQWRELFTSRMESTKFIVTPGRQSALEEATKLQSQGELLEYSIEELTAGELVAVWKKQAEV